MCYLEFYQWNKLQNAEKIAIYDFTIAEFMLSPAPLGKNAEIQKSNLSLWGVKKILVSKGGAVGKMIHNISYLFTLCDIATIMSS